MKKKSWIIVCAIVGFVFFSMSFTYTSEFISNNQFRNIEALSSEGVPTGNCMGSGTVDCGTFEAKIKIVLE